jgi:very-short-patch-repair endonuclease
VSKLENTFQLILRSEGLNEQFVREYKFHPKRKWKADFADIENRILVEIEGGSYISGRHVRPVGFQKDIEKYNSATVLGWRLLRYATVKQMRDFPEHYRKLLNENTAPGD